TNALAKLGVSLPLDPGNLPILDLWVVNRQVATPSHACPSRIPGKVDTPKPRDLVERMQREKEEEAAKEAVELQAGLARKERIWRHGGNRQARTGLKGEGNYLDGGGRGLASEAEEHGAYVRGGEGVGARKVVEAILDGVEGGDVGYADSALLKHNGNRVRRKRGERRCSGFARLILGSWEPPATPVMGKLSQLIWQVA
ncbi:hypothetical protein CRG98_029564, partial [Punica granatum]